MCEEKVLLCCSFLRDVKPYILSKKKKIMEQADIVL